MIKLSGFDKILTLPLIIVTRILNGPKAFPLFHGDVSLCTSSFSVNIIILCFDKPYGGFLEGSKTCWIDF